MVGFPQPESELNCIPVLHHTKKESDLLKRAQDLLKPDPYYSGKAGFVGSSMERLHDDMLRLDLPITVPKEVRLSHGAVRNTYIYSYFSYDLLTLAVSQSFPCLELALRTRIGNQFAGRVDRNGKPRPAMLNELLKEAKAQKLISADITHLGQLRNEFAHGSETVLNPALFLSAFAVVTDMIAELFIGR